MTILFEKFGELVKKLSFKSEKNKYDINGCKKCERGRVRCGFFPIYVGEERKKYLVPASNSPTLKTLLDHYEDQFNPLEPIALPSMSPKKFDQLLAIIKAETQLLTIEMANQRRVGGNMGLLSGGRCVMVIVQQCINLADKIHHPTQPLVLHKGYRLVYRLLSWPNFQSQQKWLLFSFLHRALFHVKLASTEMISHYLKHALPTYAIKERLAGFAKHSLLMKGALMGSIQPNR
ncbi:auxin-responsive protein SAUR22-like [Forsythia ovata]|uniref:Auxin-responsive protein SAUR22-like n=1 Tax=Forsythia ovata TaxID=205694 RepID=A0ABD1SML9_9LAMI